MLKFLYNSFIKVKYILFRFYDKITWTIFTVDNNREYLINNTIQILGK